MKILNLNEGFFPIKLDFEENELNIPNIGDLTSSLKVNLEISKISAGILVCKGNLFCEFKDKCQNCLAETIIFIDSEVNVTLKDIKEMHSDSSNDSQVHYQELDNFNLGNFLEEEIAISYPDIVKCHENCLEDESTSTEEKNLPFKKIRDLME